MRKIIFVIFGVSLLILPFSGRLATASDYNSVFIDTNTFYQDSFDNLIFDLTVPDNEGQADVLRALTVRDLNVSAHDYIETLKLYYDDNETGFQGLGVDKSLGKAFFNPEFSRWIWQDLTARIPIGGLRIFITAEIKDDVPASKVYKPEFKIDTFSDKDSDNEFDFTDGDRGIWVESANDGPTDSDIIGTMHNIRLASDIYPPKAAIDNISDNQVIETENYTITGLAKDQLGSEVVWVKVGFEKNESGTIDWRSALSTDVGNPYLTWKYEWNNIASGDYKLYVESSDKGGNSAVSERVLNVAAQFAEPEPEPEPEPQPDLFPEGLSGGDLIKGSSAAVYYLGADGQRYVFTNDNVYFSWYNDFANVQTVSDQTLALIGIGGNVTYKPGVKMIKIQSDNKVYAVGRGGVLHWIETPQLAEQLYGSDWSEKIDDVSPVFWPDYTVGESINSADDYDPASLKALIGGINENKGL